MQALLSDSLTATAKKGLLQMYLKPECLHFRAAHLLPTLSLISQGAEVAKLLERSSGTKAGRAAVCLYQF